LERVLILVRHAHRDKQLGRECDNGLSAKGKGQAEAIMKYLNRVFPQEKFALISSPKRRCVETLAPLGRFHGVSVQTQDFLDEGGALHTKIEGFIQWWEKRSDTVTVACSHGDWIPRFIFETVGVGLELSKAGLVEFRKSGGELQMVQLIQRHGLPHRDLWRK
jgi:phosphohistidine phosphatase SixA